MKIGNIFFIVFVICVLVVAGLQIYQVVYSPDRDFNKQVENHLVSIVKIKGERINDYFLERKQDVLVLADSQEVKELLKGEIYSDENIIKKSIEDGLRIIAKQIEIFMNKYPSMILSDLENDKDFQNIIFNGVGETGYTILIDYYDFDKKAFDYYKSTNVKTGDGINLGIAAKVNLEEFKALKNPSIDLTNSMKRFKEISDYKNLILISSEGYVIYEVDEDFKHGTNLEFSGYSETSLGEVYSEIKSTGEVVVLGPYSEIGDPELILLFMAPVYKNDEFVGAIALQDSMEDINEISMELTKLGKTGDSYIVDKDKFLITPSKVGNIDLLIQEVETENTESCFKESEEGILYFEDYKGDDVIGSHATISEVDWCLVAEIEEQEVFDVPKQGMIRQNLIIIFILNIILLTFGWILMKKLNKGKRK